ncbi:MAG: hypothetical protein K1W27_10170, partial [Lachnospiraceae bacterium]
MASVQALSEPVQLRTALSGFPVRHRTVLLTPYPVTAALLLLTAYLAAAVLAALFLLTAYLATLARVLLKEYACLGDREYSGE